MVDFRAEFGFETSEYSKRRQSSFCPVNANLFHFIGTCEILGGIGLILPAATGIWPELTPWAAVGLATLLVLAALFHVQRQECQAITTNVILFASAVFVAYGRFMLEPFNRPDDE